MAFQIEWKKSTKKDLRKLPPATVGRILSAVEILANNPYPHGSEKLAGSEHAYRIRVGDYRIIYEVVPGLIEIQRVRHRKDVYRT
ncbi:MAG TPA: type II toxin-antitoxin system RelE/ParE family toxin [Verrucomicrobiae bacterium]|nr:type II toxin-antitoxin system RelE/ParE family toxin [Verrucomicrobiae bacterium]